MDIKDILSDFIEWAEDCGEDAWYIFENKDKAIDRFFKEYDRN